MSCKPPTIIVGGIELSTSEFQNVQELLREVSSAGADPVFDEYNGNIADGNNTANKSGVLVTSSPEEQPPKQTTLPPPPPETPAKSNNVAPPGGNGNPTSCPLWDGNYDYQLSPNFKVRAFSSNAKGGAELTNFQNFSKQTRFCNLMNLAVNVAEPLRAKFGAFNVNSGIRNQNSVSSGISQHCLGEAMDVQWPGWTYNRYWEAAQWVKDNIKYDQFIFEHSDKTGLAWLHLSFKAGGNRGSGERTKVMTMFRNKYTPGLQRYH